MCNRMSGGGTTQRERRKTVVSIGETKANREMAETPEWIIVDFEGRGFHCERCGATDKHSTPRGVSRLASFVLRGEAFAIDHADCAPKEGTP